MGHENIMPSSLADPQAQAAPRPAGAPADVAFPKAIRSFVRRAGRTTGGQAKAVLDLGPRFVLPFSPSTLDFQAAFAPPDASLLHAGSADGERETILEIGFGMGEATAQIAALLAQKNFLCCEVHEPGVGALLKRIGEQGLSNIRILAHDAVEVIDHMLPVWSASAPDKGLDGVHIFFPDPWHKKRHNKRRLIQAPLIAKLAARLKPGGYRHCATDWQPYAEQILEVLSAEPLLTNSAEAYAPKPDYRPLTKFENRGIRLGHGVWDIVFVRR